MSSRNKGICFIILSAFSFALMGACVRLAGDVPSIQKSFFRNLVAFFVALIMIVRSGDGFEIKKGNLGYMVLRATFGTLGILCNFSYLVSVKGTCIFFDRLILLKFQR